MDEAALGPVPTTPAEVGSVAVDESALAMALTDGRTQGMIRLELPAGICKISVPVDRSTYEYGNNTFVDTQGWIAIEAEHYSRCNCRL